MRKKQHEETVQSIFIWYVSKTKILTSKKKNITKEIKDCKTVKKKKTMTVIKKKKYKRKIVK